MTRVWLFIQSIAWLPWFLKKLLLLNIFLTLNTITTKKTVAFNYYKFFIGKAWGNFSAGYLGGAYVDIIVARPNEICTENFLESGIFDDGNYVKRK